MAEIIDISKTRVCYDLPNSKDTTVFGPVFWAAFHDLASRIPCDSCKEHAESFMVFFHDMVNLRKGVPLYDKANFDKWVKIVSDLGDQRKKNNDRKILSFISAVVVAILIITIVKK